MMEKEEYLVHSKWTALKRDDGKLFYITKEHFSLDMIDSRMSKDFFIDGDIIHALKPGVLYYEKGDEFLDIHSEKEHALLLKKGKTISFFHGIYEYLPKAPFMPEMLSNTYWDGDFLQHLLHLFGVKTRRGAHWIFFWNSEKHHSRSVFKSKLCYDHVDTTREDGNNNSPAKSTLENSRLLHKDCKDYYKSFIYCKQEKIPSALYVLIRKAKDYSIPIHGKVLAWDKNKEIAETQDRIVIYHPNHDSLVNTIDLLKKNHELLRWSDKRAEPRFCKKIMPGLFYRNGGATLRLMALKIGGEKKLKEYFSGPNYSEFKLEKLS